jgi:WD40 repeat protein
MLDVESQASILASPRMALLAPDGKHLICVSPGGTWLCDRAGRLVRRYARPGSGKVFLTSTGRVIAQVGTAIRAWDWKTGKQRLDLRLSGRRPSREGYHVLRSVDATGTRALTIEHAPTKNRAFTVWDLSQGRSVSRFVAPKAFVIGAALSPDGGIVVHGGTDGYVSFYDVSSSKVIVRPAGKGWIDVVVRSDDGRLYASGGRGGVVCIWTCDGTAHGRIPFKASVEGLALSPDGALLVAYGSSGYPAIFDVETRKQVGTLESHARTGMFGGVRSAWFTPDGMRLVTVGNDLGVSVFRRTD